MVLRSIAHHPGAIDSEDFQRYFLYLLEQVQHWGTWGTEGNVLGCQWRMRGDSFGTYPNKQSQQRGRITHV